MTGPTETENRPRRRGLRRLVPIGARSALKGAAAETRAMTARYKDILVKRRSWTLAPGDIVDHGRYKLRVVDGPNFSVLVRDLFTRRLYDFKAKRADPLILDCGSNIGMSIIAFKEAYPKARVIGFEPDPSIYPVLQENLERNGVDAKIVKAALSSKEGVLSFDSDGKYGSTLAHGPEPLPGWSRHDVQCVRLRDYLDERVDFLKLNIEGLEWEVLNDSADKLHNVDQILVEYHHFPGLPRTLHKILSLLHECGFEYAIRDLETPREKTVANPFKLESDTTYFLYVYARRLEH